MSTTFLNNLENRHSSKDSSLSKGEAARLFPGAPTTYVLPAPERNSDGYPLVNGEVVDERTATEHAWLVAEGEVTHVVHLNSGYSSNWGITPEDLQNVWPRGQ